MAYKTKTQKKNAAISIERKAFRLYEAGVMTFREIESIKKICMAARKRL